MARGFFLLPYVLALALAGMSVVAPPLAAQAQTQQASSDRWQQSPLPALQAAAEAGEADAQYALALRLQEGLGVVQNYTLAVEWFARAAAQGHAAAANRLGQYYHQGLGVERNRAVAIRWLEQAAQSGQAQYLYDLALVLEQEPENTALSDPARAAALYQQAADLGHMDAAVSLGVLYQNGLGVAQDLQRARELYEGPAAAGNARAQNNLGLLYVRGSGVVQDYARAAALFQAAAEHGLPVAMGNLGTMYENGFGVALDEARAHALYRQAGRGGAPEAAEQIRAGGLFDPRLAAPDTSPEGLKQMQEAAQSGDPLAQFLLGWTYLQGGPDGLEDRSQWPRQRAAAALLRASAEAGYPAAMANLGLMYFEGRALPQDYVLGYMWLVLAATSGNSEARALSADLARRMSPEQVIEAQQKAEALARR